MRESHTNKYITIENSYTSWKFYIQETQKYIIKEKILLKKDLIDVLTFFRFLFDIRNECIKYKYYLKINRIVESQCHELIEKIIILVTYSFIMYADLTVNPSIIF